MARKRKELPVLEGIEITGVAAEGNALARVDNMVVFIPYGAPGDVATVRLTRKKHSYAEGRIERLEKPSELRCEPRCAHFGLCGGCRWQHLPYDFQLQCKRQQVVDCLDRIAKVPHPRVLPARGAAQSSFEAASCDFE
ncbi:MAG: TRAM domain-containing protein, partial [Muribaculaceae bacterium]|nr:TRAM domain-containing protein [Muribaculaceae bacterium]